MCTGDGHRSGALRSLSELGDIELPGPGSSLQEQRSVGDISVVQGLPLASWALELGTMSPPLSRGLSPSRTPTTHTRGPGTGQGRLSFVSEGSFSPRRFAVPRF